MRTIAANQECSGDPGDHVSGSRSAWLAGVLLVTVVILLRRSYQGIWHDATLYLGQALAVLHPDAFGHDLFFAYGSQAAYTLFPRALAVPLAHFSAGSVFLWLTLAGQALFAWASWRLLGRLFPVPLRLPALLALLLLPAGYGIWGTLSYAEPFFTARSLAEPLVLLALAALLAGRYWLAAAAWLMAASLHPLQALPALVVGWIWLAQSDRRWLHLAWLVLLAVPAIVLLPQASFLVTRMDAPWLESTWQRNWIVFFGRATGGDWIYLLTDLFVVGVAACRATGTLRRYLIAVMGAAVLLVIASLLLVDMLHLAWPAGLQLWRAQWLLHWSAVAALPWVCVSLWNDQCDPRGSRLILFLSVVSLGMLPASGNPAMPGVALLFLMWPWLAPRMSGWMQRGLLAAVVLVAAIALATHWGVLLAWGELSPRSGRWPHPLPTALVPVLVALMAVIGLVAWHRAGAAVRVGLAGVLLASLVYATGNWDQRTQSNRDFTDLLPADMPFGTAIAPHQQVLWLGELLPAWSVLKRPSYLNQQQLAGIVFSRSTALEGFRRLELLDVQDVQGRRCQIDVLPFTSGTRCQPDSAAVRMACERAGGELAYFVLSYTLDVAPRATWVARKGKGMAYHLYACSDFTSGPA